MTTSVTVKVPQDASYRAIVVALDAQPDGPSRSFRIEVEPGTEQTFYAHATRVIEVCEQPIEAVEVNTAAGADPLDQGPALALGGLNFGEALDALRRGARVARMGWNGKGMWLVLIYPGNAMHVSSAGAYPMMPCIGMKTASGEMLPGWLASQTDMLAEDWMLVEHAGKSVNEG